MLQDSFQNIDFF